jgi:GDSL-like lipase/acylhydrolase family protein
VTGRRVVGGRRATLALAALSIALAAGALETGLRWRGVGAATEFTPHPRWGYLMRPSQRVWSYGHPVTINARGLRGPEFALPKPAGLTRLLFVGDSITYGGGRVRNEELFCRVVEALASSGERRLEVVNLSAPGWSPQNWWAYIETEGLLGADFVVMVVPDIDLDRPFATMARHGLREHSPLLRLGSLLVRLQAAYDHRPRPSPDERRRAMEANLRAAAALRDRARPNFLAVLIPGRPPASREADWSRLFEALPGALDLRRALTVDDFMDELHLNAQGHRKVGEAIYRRLPTGLKQ